jgi:hypothetical protein
VETISKQSATFWRSLSYLGCDSDPFGKGPDLCIGEGGIGGTTKPDARPIETEPKGLAEATPGERLERLGTFRAAAISWLASDIPR